MEILFSDILLTFYTSFLLITKLRIENFSSSSTPPSGRTSGLVGLPKILPGNMSESRGGRGRQLPRDGQGLHYWGQPGFLT